MKIRILTFFILFIGPLSSFSGDLIVCDPENTALFIKNCGEVPDKSKAGIRKLPLWQNTPHQGYQLLDCKNGTIKNVIEKTKESYSCRVPIDK